MEIEIIVEERLHSQEILNQHSPDMSSETKVISDGLNIYNLLQVKNAVSLIFS